MILSLVKANGVNERLIVSRADWFDVGLCYLTSMVKISLAINACTTWLSLEIKVGILLEPDSVIVCRRELIGKLLN
jgi:hypothetical protein